MLKKIFKIANFIIQGIFLIGFIIVSYFLLKLNLLPFKYMFIYFSISIIAIALNVLSYIFKKQVIKIISLILNIILIIIYIFIYIYISKTDKFLQRLNKNVQHDTYYLAVLNDNKYNDITDLNNLKIGSYYTNIDSYNEALKNINDKITYEEVHYDNLVEMCNDLINSHIDAIILSSESKKMLEEHNELISKQLVFIYDIVTKTNINIESKDLDVTTKAFSIFISGIDTYGEIETVARSDVNIVMFINPKLKKILLVTIPRDYYVQLHGTTGLKDKLTHAGLYGIDMSIMTIEDLLDIDINYYMRLNFSSLVNAIDVIGGVDVYSEKGFYPWTNRKLYIKKGMNHMNGEMALAYARERFAFDDGDISRGQNQMKVIEAIINKLSNSRVLINNYLDILDSLDGTIQTNLTPNRIYDLVKFQLANMPSWKIEKISLGCTASHNYTYTYGKELLFVFEPDDESVEQTKKIIKQMMK